MSTFNEAWDVCEYVTKEIAEVWNQCRKWVGTHCTACIGEGIEKRRLTCVWETDKSYIYYQRKLNLEVSRFTWLAFGVFFWRTVGRRLEVFITQASSAALKDPFFVSFVKNPLRCQNQMGE
jgi:hypothetical protein